MPSSSPYDLMDWSFDIKVVQQSRGGRNQTTFAWEPASSSSTLIAGNFQATVTEDDEREIGGIVPEGSAILYTEADLPIDARVTVSFDQGNTVVRTYSVKKLLRQFSTVSKIFGSPVRRKYFLVLEGK